MTDAITIDSHLPHDWAQGEMLEDLRRTFSNTPKVLRPKWLYDERGSQLFDQITRLRQYYPTEAERSILVARAQEIAKGTGADTVIELGSGTSDKMRILLDAFWETGQLRRFVPLDVSRETLIDAAKTLADRYEGLAVHAVVGDFSQHLPHLPSDGQRLIAFLGGTVGNFYSEERRAFLGAISDVLAPGEWLLLGVDLAKNAQRIIDAYSDEDGVTEEFITNVVNVINNEFDADLPVDQFEYVPFWDPKEERVDMRLRAAMPMTARIEALDIDVDFEEGEELRVEISTKFRPERIQAEVTDAGFEVEEFWTSEESQDARIQADDFGLILARRL